MVPSLCLLALLAPPAGANTIVLPSDGEPSLLGHHGILDTLYPGGWTRLSDSMDPLWPQGGGSGEVTVTATVVAKYAGFNQTFGYIPFASGPGFVSLLPPVTTNCAFGPACSGPSGSFTITGPFRFADLAGGQIWSSLPSDNRHHEDHMVSFLTSTGSYVLAFEDLPFGNGGNGHDSDDEHHHGKQHHDPDDEHSEHHDSDDRKGDRDDEDSHHDKHHGEHHGHHKGGLDGSDRDYNDLVVEVSFQPVEPSPPPPPIPEPPMVGLMGLGLGVLIAGSRRITTG